MDWIKMIADKPDSLLILLAGVLAFVFYMGQLLERIKGVQTRQAVVVKTLETKADRSELANLVTKEDLKLAMAEFSAQLAKDLREGFVSTIECELKHKHR